MWPSAPIGIDSPRRVTSQVIAAAAPGLVVADPATPTFQHLRPGLRPIANTP